jgi:hypothetical protein
MWGILVAYENNFIQHRAGMLGEEQYAATLGSLKFQSRLPGFRAVWLQAREAFEVHFASCLDEIMRTTPVALNSTANSLVRWKALAAEEIAKAPN